MATSQFKGSQVYLKLDANFTGSLPAVNLGTGQIAPTSGTYLRGDGVWLNSPDKPASQFRQFAWLHEPGTFNLAGWNTGTGPGTFGNTSHNNDATGDYVNYSTTNANILTPAGWNSLFTLFQTQWKLVPTMVIKTTNLASDLTNVRMTFGLGSGDLSASDNPAGLHIMGFRYSPVSDTTAFWRTYTSDGTTVNVQATTIPIAVTTRYVLKIDASNPASIKFYINNVLTNTHTTNLPNTTQSLGLTMLSTNVTAAAHALYIGRFHIEYGV